MVRPRSTGKQIPPFVGDFLRQMPPQAATAVETFGEALPDVDMVAVLARCSDDEVHAFFEDIAHGNRSQAAARFSPELHKKFSENTLDDALTNWTKEFLAHGGLKDIDVSGGVISYNKLALYDVVLTYGDGKTKMFKTTLVYDDDGWYINTAL